MISLKQLFLFILLIGCNVMIGKNHQKQCYLNIIINEFKVPVTLYNKIDTIELHDYDNHFLITEKLNCDGTIHLKEFNKKGLVKEGSYISTNDTTIIIEVVTDIESDPVLTRKDTLICRKMEKNGLWKYYNAKGKLIKTEIYYNGQAW